MPLRTRPHVYALSCLAAAGLGGWLTRQKSQAAPERPTVEQWAEKIRAGWVGKVAAGSGALPTEMWSKDNIRRKYGMLNGPPQTPTPRGPLDDTTLAFLGWQAACERGTAFTSADIAAEWVEHLTDADLEGGGFGKEFFDTLRRLRGGELPPLRTGTPRAEWIAAQMRAEIWGMLAPGDPQRAADYAARDAEIFNVGNGVYAAQFVAALASQLMVEPDIPAAIAVAVEQVPADSVLAQLIRDTVQWHTEQPGDWEQTWQTFVDTRRDRSMEQRFAAWSPKWLVETGGWPETDVLPDYRGQQNVLRTHPFGETEPAVLSTAVSAPAGGGSLKLRVNCNERPADVDWLLRVRVEGVVVREETIRWTEGEPRWQDLTVDLKPWAGKQITLALENAVTGKFGWEAGFWTPPQLVDGAGNPLRAERPTDRPYRYPLEFTPKILPETFAVLVGLLYGDGDFRKSVSLATMCGFDTDCNAGTVGCLLGIRNGLNGIPAEWKDPIQDRYELQVTGLPRQWEIAELAKEMAETGEALARGQTGQTRPTGPTPAGFHAGKPLPPLPVAKRTGRFTLMALGDNSLGDLALLSHRYDLMIASHSVGKDVLDAFRQRNPGAQVFCYFNTSDVNADWIKDPYYARIWNDTNPREDWFHHDARGERVRIYYPKYKNRCAFNTGKPELQRYLAKRVVETLKTGWYDGIQLDNVSTEFPFFEKLVGKWISAPPVKLTPAGWTADEVALLQVIMQAAADAGFDEKTIIFNHMRSGEPEESRAYVDVTDGANCESWLSQRTELEDRWGWKEKVEQVREVNRLGKLTNLLCVPSQLSEDEALFCFASYLMALDGDRCHFFYGANHKIAGQKDAWYPFYDVDLGEPAGECAPREGGFWRLFAKGAVVVNPTQAAVRVNVPPGHVSLLGESVQALTLQPKRGAVLLLAAA
ncbi:MAG: hypothetical protein COY42_33470 [Armatimonadetes bacterium CG_4_10_14_0_8_um_filter_66_14]|nr:hypothetical protein [Armatimonadota bacterium]PIZ30792.1 MAG: hypothetical protein COY42_33470 [Armatimonadetes bacterium CG_4_10_14_0_8_um_filter_66_14]